MTGRSDTPPNRAVATALLLIAGGAMLGGCAGVGDSFASVAFVDPAKYDQYSCTQLEGARSGLISRTAELEGLILKARTGTGGVVVGEMVYRNEYVSTRASLKQIDEYFIRNKCEATAPAAATPIAPPAPPPARAKR